MGEASDANDVCVCVKLARRNPTQIIARVPGDAPDHYPPVFETRRVHVLALR